MKVVAKMKTALTKEYESFEALQEHYASNGFELKPIKGLKNKYNVTNVKTGNTIGMMSVIDADKY